MVIHARQKLGVSERRACSVTGISRSTMRYQGVPRDDDALRLDLIRLAKQYGRYGYRMIAGLWREEGLQLPARHKKRKRIYHKDASVTRLRPKYPNHIWAIDVVHDKLSNGRPYKMLTVMDEYTRQAFTVQIGTKLGSAEVLVALYPLIIKHGKPKHIRSDNGPEFVSETFQTWLKRVGIEPIHIYPGSPWENGYNERFNGTLRNEILNANWFRTTCQAQATINRWIKEYNHIRPHQSLGMRPPIPETTTLKLDQT